MGIARTFYRPTGHHVTTHPPSSAPQTPHPTPLPKISKVSPVEADRPGSHVHPFVGYQRMKSTFSRVVGVYFACWGHRVHSVALPGIGLACVFATLPISDRRPAERSAISMLVQCQLVSFPISQPRPRSDPRPTAITEGPPTPWKAACDITHRSDW